MFAVSVQTLCSIICTCSNISSCQPWWWLTYSCRCFLPLCEKSKCSHTSPYLTWLWLQKTQWHLESQTEFCEIPGQVFKTCKTRANKDKWGQYLCTLMVWRGTSIYLYQTTDVNFVLPRSDKINIRHTDHYTLLLHMETMSFDN